MLSTKNSATESDISFSYCPYPTLKKMPRGFNSAVIVYHLLNIFIHKTFGQFVQNTKHSKIVTLIHDNSTALQYSEGSIEIWIQIIAENFDSQCQDSVLTKFIYVAPGSNISEKLTQYDYGEIHSETFVIVTQCGTAEAIIRHLWTLLHNPNIIFLDLFICQSLRQSEAFHLETFRFKSEIRSACVQFAAHQWMEKTVCSSGMDHQTKAIFDLTFSIDAVVEKCNLDRNPNPSSQIYLSNLESERNYVRRFLNGKPLRVAAVEDKPWIRFDRSPTNSSITYNGIFFDFFHILQDNFNFTYTVSEPEDRRGVYGVETHNATWDGMLGMIYFNETDIVVDNYYLTPLRYQSFDFVIIGDDPAAILIPPATEDHGLFACTKPFGMDVWILVLVLLVLLPFIIWICAKNFAFSPHNSSGTSLKRVYLFVYSVLVSQSNSSKVPKNKIILLYLVTVWSLTAVLLTNVYKGKIVSSLLIPKFNPIINSIEELPASSLKLVVVNGTAFHTMFMNAGDKDGVYGQIGEGLRQNPESILSWHKSESEIRNLVTSGTYAAINSLSFMEFVMEKDYLETKQCRLSLAKEDFFKPGFGGMVVRKDNPLATIFNKKMLQVMQSGINQHLHQKNRPKILAENACEDFNSSKEQPKLKLRNLLGTFLVLVFGLAIASVAFLLEMIHHKMTTQIVTL